MNHEYFKAWRENQLSFFLFFDGASKNKTSVASAGGVIFIPKGHLAYTFSWNLGTLSNNLVESYALLQGLTIAKSLNL
jgi:ribonuclease HI